MHEEDEEEEEEDEAPVRVRKRRSSHSHRHAQRRPPEPSKPVVLPAVLALCVLVIIYTLLHGRVARLQTAAQESDEASVTAPKPAELLKLHVSTNTDAIFREIAAEVRSQMADTTVEIKDRAPYEKIVLKSVRAVLGDTLPKQQVLAMMPEGISWQDVTDAVGPSTMNNFYETAHGEGLRVIAGNIRHRVDLH